MKRRAACMVLAGLFGCASQGVGDADGEPAPGLRAEAIAELPACAPERWCWEKGVPVSALHGVADDAVYAVTADGNVLTWTGERWRVHTHLTEGSLRDVWVAARDDVWVTSEDGGVYRFDGARWNLLPVRGTNLRASTPTNVWIDRHHFDGRSWHGDHLPTGGERGLITDVLPIGAREAYALRYGWVETEAGDVLVGLADGERGALLHFDGAAWHEVTSAASVVGWLSRLVRVNGELRIVEGDRAYRFDGTAWQVETIGAGPPPSSGPASEPRAFVLHDGHDFRSMPAGSPCRAATRIDEDTAFCIGEHGVVQRLADGRWVDTVADPFEATRRPEDWGRIPPALWAGNARAAWGSGPSDVWRVREDPARPPEARAVVEHYDGRTWQERGSGRAYTAILASSPADVWIVGTPLMHWDGARLAPVPLPDDVRVHAGHAFADEAYFVSFGSAAAGGRGALWRYAEGVWSLVRETAPEGQLDAVVGSEDGTLWVLGSDLGETRRHPRHAYLLVREQGVWRRTELGEHSRMHELVLRGDTLWISGFKYLAALSTAPGAAPATLGGARLEPQFSRLWVGPDDLWLYTSRAAVRHVLRPQGGST